MTRPLLRAECAVAAADAHALLTRFCDHFAEHFDVEAAGGNGRIAFGFGHLGLVAEEGRLAVAVETDDAVNLSYLKVTVAEHAVELADGPPPSIRWSGDGTSSGRPNFFREMSVVSAEDVAPHMRRVRLAGRDLGRLAWGGLHVRLLFPPADRAPVWPSLSEEARLVFPEGDDALTARVYTIRAIDPAAGTLDVDMVVHGGAESPGARFATDAAPGEIVGLLGPGGGDVPDARALLMAGDETALPAIARILEALPADARAKVIVEADHEGLDYPLASRADVEVEVLARHGRAPGTASLLPDAVRNADLAALGPDPFVWFAAEFADYQAVRAHLRETLRLPRERSYVAPYWRRD